MLFLPLFEACLSTLFCTSCLSLSSSKLDYFDNVLSDAPAPTLILQKLFHDIQLRHFLRCLQQRAGAIKRILQQICIVVVSLVCVIFVGRFLEARRWWLPKVAELHRSIHAGGPQGGSIEMVEETLPLIILSCLRVLGLGLIGSSWFLVWYLGCSLILVSPCRCGLFADQCWYA